MVVVLTHKKMFYLVVNIFDNLVGPFCIYICDFKLFGCAVCFDSAIA